MHVIKRLMANYDTTRQCLNFVGTDFDVRPCSASLNINVNMNKNAASSGLVMGQFQVLVVTQYSILILKPSILVSFYLVYLAKIVK